MFETGGGVRRQNRDIFSIFFNIKERCVFSLESLDDAILMSTYNILFSTYKRKSALIIPSFFPRD